MPFRSLARNLKLFPRTPAVPARHLHADTERLIALVVGVFSSALVPLLYAQKPIDAAAPGLIAVLAWACVALLHLGYRRYVVHVLVFGTQLAAMLDAVAYGSLRSASTSAMVAAVAGAGIFLSRRALVAAVCFALGAMALLTLAEWHGHIRVESLTITLNTLLTHGATTMVVALVVFYARRQNDQALHRLSTELEARRASERQRDRSMSRFARIFRNSPSPLVAQSARTGRILDVNPAFERHFGYKRSQVLGHDDAFLWAEPEHREAYLHRLWHERRTEKVAVHCRRADGSTFEAVISSELGDARSDQLIITTVDDVTAQNAAMEQLRRSEERFSKAFNFSPLNMTVTRLSDGQFIEVNRAEDKVQGRPRDELLGKTSVEMGVWPSPEDRAAFVARLRRDGHVHGYETRMRHKDGRLVDSRLWAEIIDIDGEPCVLSCTVNVSEEKRREALLSELARGMAGHTGEALFDSLTRHMAQALGADMAGLAETTDDQWMRTLAVYADGARAPDYSYLLAGTPCEQAMRHPSLCIFARDVDLLFPNDAELKGHGFKAYVGQGLFDEDGQPIGILHALWKAPMALDTQRQTLMSIFAGRATAELLRARREREVRQLNATLEQRVLERTAELQKLNDELDSFAYSVSHDLKSPLRAIDGFTRVLNDLLDEKATPEERQLLDRVLGATQRMGMLIADLLALARISQGALERQPVDMSAMAQEVLEHEQERQPQRMLQWRIAPGLQAHCDPRLIRIALENLLGNAVKYTRDQPQPLIEFHSELPADGGAPVFVVRDNGTGFNMAYADKLFKPFQRLHRPGSGFEGTGIGLATVRRAVERHGGTISACAEPGRGAEFRFTLSAPDTPGPETAP
ncbi:hypothetical protein GCM10007935_01900 [Hydrogenophaga electricum]|uniref:histidine kinase n=1 Tax=Hydrogenophaga electricum TaxID=1230953 RepID=A0ABQ6C189_9BURK|nr:hypothetical protein GCM10007935_01900 [Hydrogenophaga electricum]